MDDEKQPTEWAAGMKPLRFSMRSLLVVVTAVCVAATFAVTLHRRQQQRLAMQQDFREAGADLRLVAGSYETYDLTTSRPRELDIDRIIKEGLLLRSLTICRDCDDAMLEQLSGLKHLEFLVIHDDILDAPEDKITDEGLSRIADIDSLRMLEITGCDAITEAGIAHLTAMKNLRTIQLPNTRIDDAGVAHLSKLPRLGHLMLNSRLITDASLQSLRSAKRLCSLTVVNAGDRLTADEVEAFKEDTSVHVHVTR